MQPAEKFANTAFSAYICENSNPNCHEKIDDPGIVSDADFRGGGCSEGGTEELKNISVPQESRELTLAATDNFRKVAFETTLPWQASVAETRAVSWLDIDPTSGPAGSNAITLTLQPNTGEEPRTAVITITAGGEKATVTVTQAGTGEQPGTDPTLPTGELLTRVDWNSTWNSPASDHTEAREEHHSGFIRIGYDEQQRAVFFGDYEFDGENGEKEKLSFYSERKYDRTQKGRIVAYERYFELETWSPAKNYLIAYKQDDYKEEESYKLDDAGRVAERIVESERADGTEYRYYYSYNADGTLAKCTDNSNETTTYEWTDGNITAIDELYNGNSHSRKEYTYTEYPNDWHGIELAMTLEDATPGYALGIVGKNSKNLIATTVSGSGSDTYDYTFDDKGRIATMTIVSRETRYDGKTETGTHVYTFRYGPQSEESYPEATHLIRQEITDRGTRDHSDAECYTSYLKIRNHFSDGTTGEEEATQELRMMVSGGDYIGDLSIPAGATPTASAPTSVSLDTTAPENSNTVYYRFTLHYSCFDIPTTWELYVPTYQLYTGYETRYQDYAMPTRPVTEASFGYDLPELTDDGYGRYHFRQDIWAKLSPDAPVTTKTNISCFLVSPTE